MPSPVLTVTLQAALFSIASTLLAQSITMYQSRQLSWIDSTSLLRFMTIAIIMTPPNYFYQKLLEDAFPARPEIDVTKGQERGKGRVEENGNGNGKLSISNTIRKFVLDQSIGAAGNTVAFIVLVDVLRGYGGDTIVGDVRKDLWPMMKAGWSFWPLVSLSNLVVVPFEYRMLVGNISGLLWGTYVNLKVL